MLKLTDRSATHSSASELLGVPSQCVPKIWPAILPWIVNACESMNGRIHAADFFIALLNKDKQLWVSVRDDIIEACCITEIVNYPHKKYCVVNIVTGHGRLHWQKFMDHIETWALTQGCDGIEAIARTGWERIMKHWTKSHVFLEREF